MRCLFNREQRVNAGHVLLLSMICSFPIKAYSFFSGSFNFPDTFDALLGTDGHPRMHYQIQVLSPLMLK